MLQPQKEANPWEGFTHSQNAVANKFPTVMDSVDGSTASGRFVIDIIFRIAEWESEQIDERVSLGLKKGKSRIPEWEKRKIIAA